MRAVCSLSWGFSFLVGLGACGHYSERLRRFGDGLSRAGKRVKPARPIARVPGLPSLEHR